MIFENRILRRVPCSDTPASLSDCFILSGLELMQYSDNADICESVRSAALQLTKCYSSFSDVLSFVASGWCRSESLLRYKLHPPYTTNFSGCRAVFGLLFDVGMIEDASYSELSQSFIIKLAEGNSLSVVDILGIGICEWFRTSLDSSANGIHTAFNVQLRYPDGSIRHADAVCAGIERIFILNFKTSVGLEADVPTHSRQLQKLKAKISRSKHFYFCSVKEYFIVSSYTARLMPPLKCVVPIDKAENLVVRMCAEIYRSRGDK